MDVNHFGSSTALLSKHFTNNLCQYLILHIYKFTRSHNLPSPSLSPPPLREEATNWSNSDIRTLNSIFTGYYWYPKNFPSYSKSRDHFILIINDMILINCFAVCSARQFHLLSYFFLSHKCVSSG